MKQNFKTRRQSKSTVADIMEDICIVTALFQVFRLFSFIFFKHFQTNLTISIQQFPPYKCIVNDRFAALYPGSFEPGQ